MIDPNPNAQPGVPYKAKTSGDERHTRPLAETPQNIQVLTSEQIKDSGYTDLREILDAQPGITLGTGENGNAFGDRYIIRGQEARSDVFVDGLRDPGMTIRESFAVEQIEISKGPNSSFAGRGTAGGAVNAITKQATMDYNFAKLSAGFGSDEHQRYTIDANQVLNDVVALRANVLYGEEEVPDRDPAERKRKGIALSGLFDINDNLNVTLDYYGFRADDLPDIGGYLEGTVPHRRPADNVPVYLQKQDFLESDVDTYTARVHYKFNDAVRLTNLTRYGESDNSYVVTGARSATTGANNPGGVYTTATLSTHQGWQEVEYIANQTNLFINADLAGMKHEFIVGLEYTKHDVLNGVYNFAVSGQNCITGNGSTLNAFCAIDASGNAVNNLDTLMNRQISKGDFDQDWAIETTSLSFMDTVDLTDDLTLFAGIRYDIYDFDLKAYWNHDNSNTTPNVLGNFKDDNGFWNAHAGLTYQLTDQGNIYFSFATSNDINGGESDVGTSSGYGGLAANFVCTDLTNSNVALRGCSPNGDAEADPEKSELFELGTKWNLLDEELLLSAAVFQIEKTDVMEGEGYTATGSFNTGENRVRGIELGAVGEITERLMLQTGFTLMRSEVLKSAVATNEGKALSNFANRTAYAQLKYEVINDLWIGAAAKYESEKYAGQPDTARASVSTTDLSAAQPIPSYTVYDLFGTYRFNKHFDVRLNIGNVTDKEYYTAGYRSGSFLYIGDARNYRVTLNYEF
ncbi:MAG: TonB-dependent receptor [Spongiibacteraceae bacterium]